VPVVSAGGVHSASVSCSTCHSMMAPNPTRRAGDELVRFHKDAHVAHGNLTCLSCHNESDYDSLRLADGTAVDFSDVMTLCAQCHGTQARDYEHGVHGGATGYWDTTRGPQVRNQCTHCHAPHAPTYKRMQPTFKPRDRFLYPKPSAATSTQVREDDR
ncbi:MAG: cytochrome c3 family protein, partial [Planctomycetota bacterium]|nr:cytochrome c3 family protein [Planctomycetota bacterium]